MITLVIGGARSGKSEVAEDLARRGGAPVTYVATGSATDADMQARIARHRARRHAAWETLELEPGSDLGALVRSVEGTVIVDSLGTWVAWWPALASVPRPAEPAETSGGGAGAEAASFCEALAARHGDTILVSEEVGLGVHPVTDLGRRFRDEMGSLNRAVAGLADDVLLVVAGRVLRLDEP